MDTVHRSKSKFEYLLLVLHHHDADEPWVSIRKVGPSPTRKALRETVLDLDAKGLWDVTKDVPESVGLANLEGLKKWFEDGYMPGAKHYVIRKQRVRPKSRFKPKDAVMCLVAGAECRVQHKDGRAWDRLGQKLAADTGMRLPIPCPRCDDGTLKSGHPCRACLGSAVLPPHYPRRQK